MSSTRAKPLVTKTTHGVRSVRGARRESALSVVISPQGSLINPDALKATGVIVPWVFWRMVKKGRGSEQTVSPKRITTFGKAWKTACKRAGCPGRIPHDLRRTAVRNFIRAGIPQQVAKKLTGHRTDAVFNRYNIVSEGDLVDAAQRMTGRHVVNE